MSPVKIILILLLAVLLAGGGFLYYRSQGASKQAEELTGDVEHREMDRDEVIEAKQSGNIRDLLEANRQDEELSVDDYLKQLEAEDAKARIDAVKHLAEFPEDPRVVPTLERVAAEDPDMFVQRIAKKMLEKVQAPPEDE